MSKSFWYTLAICLLLTGCEFTQDGSTSNSTPPTNNQDPNGDNSGASNPDTCVNDNPDGISCLILNNYSNLISDSFERDNFTEPGNTFGWRKIIDDFGTIVSGQAGNNVDAQIYSDSFMGPASDGTRALYSFGRMGFSVHNIYLITETFNSEQILGQADSVVIQFDYLALDLEPNEYLRLEVCNDSAEACGVGQELTIAGLNSDKWKVEFEISNETAGLNGRNHEVSDFKTAKITLFLENYQKNEFIFRFNSRMDEGFPNGDSTQNLVDGVVIDNVRATIYDINGEFENDIDNPEDILDFDPTQR